MTEDKIKKVLELSNQRDELRVFQSAIGCDHLHTWRIVTPSFTNGIRVPDILRYEFEKSIERCIESINKKLERVIVFPFSVV